MYRCATVVIALVINISTREGPWIALKRFGS